jgi:hypothetical protein
MEGEQSTGSSEVVKISKRTPSKEGLRFFRIEPESLADQTLDANRPKLRRHRRC